MSRPVPPWPVLFFIAAVGLLPACGTGSVGAGVHLELTGAAAKDDPLAIADALEDLIAGGRDTPADRDFAYRRVRAHPSDTAKYAYARAVVTGRLVQQKGLLGVDMVGEVEQYARRSRELDPDFRDGAATRMLGTLYVVAPAPLLRHGDSETGLELLISLVEKRPDVLENHLRVAEAYVALGDPEPAKPHLCIAVAGKARLRRDDQALLAQLLKDAGNYRCEGAAAVKGSP
jgi:hypothetical protein